MNDTFTAIGVVAASVWSMLWLTVFPVIGLLWLLGALA